MAESLGNAAELAARWIDRDPRDEKAAGERPQSVRQERTQPRSPVDFRVASLVQWLARVSPSPTPIVLALPAGATVASFTEGCRAAALDFVNRVVASDDKAVLAEWLRGPYRSHAVTLARSRTRRMGAARVLPAALSALLAKTRYDVSVGLQRASDPVDGVGFGYSALASGHVYRCQDFRGAQGWVPVAQPKMRLADRVLSLVAADYLANSDDYETSLYTCSACGLTEFDPARAALGVCRAHAHSDIRELSSSYVHLMNTG